MIDGGRRKTLTGIVVSDKSEKTGIVMVERKIAHPRDGKMVRKSKRFMAHDNENKSHVGDTVRIIETRPMSKLKRWRVSEIVEKAK